MKAFLFYIDDYLSSPKVQLMDAHEERGYLRLLLREAASEDCSLPDDDVQLAVISLLGAQWNRPTKDRMFRIGETTSGQKLRECFGFRPPGAISGRLYNERLYREFIHQADVNSKRSDAGRKANEARWGKRTPGDIPIAIPNGYQTVSQMVSQTNPNPSTNSSPTSSAASPATAEQVEQIRAWLFEFMGGKWPMPDARIARQIQAALRGRDLEQLGDLLRSLHARGRRPGKSWAWFVGVVEAEFEGVA